LASRLEHRLSHQVPERLVCPTQYPDSHIAKKKSKHEFTAKITQLSLGAFLLFIPGIKQASSGPRYAASSIWSAPASMEQLLHGTTTHLFKAIILDLSMSRLLKSLYFGNTLQP
jgi:hypothetical protein